MDFVDKRVSFITVAELENSLKDILMKPLLQGWKRLVVNRNDRSRFDTYYFSPTGKKFRSSKQLERYLTENESEFTIRNFTFQQKFLGLGEPYEVQKFAVPSKNGEYSVRKPKKVKQEEDFSFVNINNPRKRKMHPDYIDPNLISFEDDDFANSTTKVKQTTGLVPQNCSWLQKSFELKEAFKKQKVDSEINGKKRKNERIKFAFNFNNNRKKKMNADFSDESERNAFDDDMKSYDSKDQEPYTVNSNFVHLLFDEPKRKPSSEKPSLPVFQMSLDDLTNLDDVPEDAGEVPVVESISAFAQNILSDFDNEVDSIKKEDENKPKSKIRVKSLAELCPPAEETCAVARNTAELCPPEEETCAVAQNTFPIHASEFVHAHTSSLRNFRLQKSNPNVFNKQIDQNKSDLLDKVVGASIQSINPAKLIVTNNLRNSGQLNCDNSSPVLSSKVPSVSFVHKTLKSPSVKGKLNSNVRPISCFIPSVFSNLSNGSPKEFIS